MRSQSLKIVCLFAIFLISLTSSAVAQVFQVSSAPTAAATTELVALAGTIEFTVTSGTTGAGSIVVTFNGVTIANTASEITVSDTCVGGNAAVSAVDQANGTVTISVPSGCTVGKKVTLAGVRVDIASSGVSSVSATISASGGSGFGFVAGGTEVTVINAVKEGLKVEADSDTVLTYQGTAFSNPGLFFKVSEGFASSFSDAVGTLGQTVKTRIRIVVTGLREGSKLTFPNSVTDSVTGATLTALAGSELTLPKGGTTITYEFDAAATSATKIETFEIQYTLDVQLPPSELAVVFLQATLFPSDTSDIPRFQTRLLPADEELQLPEFDDFLPRLLGGEQFTGIAFTNPADFEVRVLLEAFRPNGESLTGPDITNPVTLTLPALAQRAVLLEELFGSGIGTAEVGTIRARSRRSRTVSLFLLGDENSTFLDGATAGQDRLRNFLFPNIAHEGFSPFTSVNIFNPSSSASVEVQMTLHSDVGTAVASETVTLAAGGTLSQDLADLLGVDPSSVSGGYIRGTATGEVVAFESFGNSQALNVLNAQNPEARQEIYRIPHFAVGGGFDTELNLINTHPAQTAVMEILALDDQGMALAGVANPIEISLEPGEQTIFSIASGFGFPSQELIAGSLRIDVQEFFLGPIPSFPTLSGSIRFKTGRLSASVPLRSIVRTSALYPHVAQTSALFTGVAMVNSQTSPAKQTVEIFDREGALVGTTTFTLASGARKTALLSELVPASDGQSGGYFRVRGIATRDVLFSGSHDGSSGSANLVDGLRNFDNLGIGRFIDIARNVTDGSEGIITAIDGSTITVTLSGGSGNDWDAGDQYEILDGERPGVISFALFGDLAGEFLSVIPSQ
ncbi:hypothetical protein MYX82_04800 [Acidobacteria bacterium AH-259-D05]|nr:hypothetical protein [Acidobacteria bacterium AH-259-D05]